MSVKSYYKTGHCLSKTILKTLKDSDKVFLIRNLGGGIWKKSS